MTHMTHVTHMAALCAYLGTLVYRFMIYVPVSFQKSLTANPPTVTNKYVYAYVYACVGVRSYVNSLSLPPNFSFSLPFSRPPSPSLLSQWMPRRGLM